MRTSAGVCWRVICARDDSSRLRKSVRATAASTVQHVAAACTAHRQIGAQGQQVLGLRPELEARRRRRGREDLRDAPVWLQIEHRDVEHERRSIAHTQAQPLADSGAQGRGHRLRLRMGSLTRIVVVLEHADLDAKRAVHVGCWIRVLQISNVAVPREVTEMLDQARDTGVRGHQTRFELGQGDTRGVVQHQPSRFGHQQ